jgi:hypothetical protein
MSVYWVYQCLWSMGLYLILIDGIPGLRLVRVRSRVVYLHPLINSTAHMVFGLGAVNVNSGETGDPLL